MADDFLQGAQVGGSLVSQGWQRQERMMELRARAAQQAIRERESVARLQVLLRDQAIQEEELTKKKLLGEAGKRMMLENKEKYGLDDLEALGSIIAPVTAMDAEAGLRISQAYENAKQGMMAGRAVATTPHQKVLEEQAAARLEMQKSAEERRIAQEGRLKEREARIASMQINEADRKKIGSIYKQVDALVEKFEEMPDMKGWWDPQPNAEKEALGKRIKLLQAEAEKIATKGGAAKAPTTLKLGAIVRNKGKMYRYQGGPVDDPASFVEVPE